ncbi:hypothetical protein [Desulfosediminicola ganghwensis]|uniref:hypothetical protein n=1 Tax=Desulfosediminicola ganghwensis TaxID=2569540 RepID=UPI0010AD9F22|nr:hypothetical protein [Desulfosediminicola ganghwensis]
MKDITNFLLEIAIVLVLCCFFLTTLYVNNSFATDPESGYGVLVIPTVVSNKTSYPFCYYYSLLYEPKSTVKIDVRPRVNKQFIAIKKFPVGKYSINAIKVLTAPTFRVVSFQTPKTHSFKKGMNFKIKANTINVLHYGLNISMRYKDDDFTSREFFQLHKFYALSKGELKNLAAQLRTMSKFSGMPVRYKGKKRNRERRQE